LISALEEKYETFPSNPLLAAAIDGVGGGISSTFGSGFSDDKKSQ
jgi:hypothetical protein